MYDRQPLARLPLLQAMDEACRDIEVGSVQGWIRHIRQYFPHCLASDDIASDVDEVMWPDQAGNSGSEKSRQCGSDLDFHKIGVGIKCRFMTK